MCKQRKNEDGQIFSVMRDYLNIYYGVNIQRYLMICTMHITKET